MISDDLIQFTTELFNKNLVNFNNILSEEDAKYLNLLKIRGPVLSNGKLTLLALQDNSNIFIRKPFAEKLSETISKKLDVNIKFDLLPDFESVPKDIEDATNQDGFTDKSSRAHDIEHEKSKEELSDCIDRYHNEIPITKHAVFKTLEGDLVVQALMSLIKDQNRIDIIYKNETLCRKLERYLPNECKYTRKKILKSIFNEIEILKQSGISIRKKTRGKIQIYSKIFLREFRGNIAVSGNNFTDEFCKQISLFIRETNVSGTIFEVHKKFTRYIEDNGLDKCNWYKSIDSFTKKINQLNGNGFIKMDKKVNQDGITEYQILPGKFNSNEHIYEINDQDKIYTLKSKNVEISMLKNSFIHTIKEIREISQNIAENIEEIFDHNDACKAIKLFFFTQVKGEKQFNHMTIDCNRSDEFIEKVIEFLEIVFSRNDKLFSSDMKILKLNTDMINIKELIKG